jgi:hypothetical protein
MIPTINANNENIGIILFVIKYENPTKEQSIVKQIGTLAVMIIIKTKSNQSDKKKSPIFLIISLIINKFNCHFTTHQFWQQ